MKVLERLVVAAILPQRGDYITIQTVMGIKDRVNLSQEEREAINLRASSSGGLQWDDDKDPNKDIVFSKGELSVVRKALTELNSTKQLTPDHAGLYEKYVIGGENE